MATPNFNSLAQQYTPTSAMYQALMGFAKNPTAWNPQQAANFSTDLTQPVYPSIQQPGVGTVPYNAPAQPGGTYTQSAPGSPGVPAAPQGSVLNASTLAPGGAAAAPPPVAQPVGSTVAGRVNPSTETANTTATAGTPITTQQGDPGTPGGGASGDPPSPSDSTLSNILGSIFGSGGAPSLSSLLSSAIPIGSALWSYLGSQGAFNTAGNLINSAELNAGSEVNTAAQGAGSGVLSAANSAANGVQSATASANDILQSLYGSTTGLQTPYAAAGVDATTQLASGLQPGGNLNSTLTANQVLQNDPGYQFRLGQGEGDLQARLASEGLGDSGAAGKELSQFQQDYASNEFSNAWQRQQTAQQNLYSRLSGTAGIGQNANQQDLVAAETLGAPQASNFMTSGQYGGNALQTGAENSGLFDVQGSQYQGNAGVTGAGAQAGATIDANQAKQAMIQQIMTSLLSLFGKSPGSPTGTGTTINVG